MTHNIEEDGTMSSRTVSSSDYHAKCAGCVAKERTIDNLQTQLVSEREFHALSSGFLSMMKGERDILQAKLDAHAESEASVCPEDVGCIEYIKTLQAKVARLEADNRGNYN